MKYLELNYFDEDHSEQLKTLGKLWHLVHAIATRHKVAFQVSFPFWMNPIRAADGAIRKAGTFGPVIRLFGSGEGLSSLAKELSSHRLIQSGFVAMSLIRDVPDTGEYVSFVRSRVRDRVTDGYAKQAERNMAMRARNRPDFSSNHVLHHSALLAAERTVLANFVALRSSGNGNKYSLNVEQRRCDNTKSVNSYGLGGVVPVF